MFLGRFSSNFDRFSTKSVPAKHRKTRFGRPFLGPILDIISIFLDMISIFWIWSQGGRTDFDLEGSRPPPTYSYVFLWLFRYVFNVFWWFSFFSTSPHPPTTPLKLKRCRPCFIFRQKNGPKMIQKYSKMPKNSKKSPKKAKKSPVWLPIDV